MGIGAQVFGCFPQSGSGQVVAVERQGQPAPDQAFVQLKVKLESPCAFALAKGLAPGFGRHRQGDGAGGAIEAPVVPLINRSWTIQRGKYGIVRRDVGRFEIVPADFRSAARTDRRTEYMGHKLGAQADAEYRHIPRHRLFNQSTFSEQVRMGVGIVDLHRSAQHDQCLIAIQPWRGFGVAGEIDVADSVPVFAQHGIEQSQWLGGNMLQNQYAGHDPVV